MYFCFRYLCDVESDSYCGGYYWFGCVWIGFFFGDIIFVFNFIYIEILNKKVIVEFVWYILFVVNMILFCNFELIFLINVNIWIKNDFSINVDMI